MKNVIILCSPTSEDFRKFIPVNKGYFFPPLGLLLVAQTLKNAGYEVKLYDGNCVVNYKKDLLDYVSVNHEKILFIGFYLALLQIKDCTDIIKAVKSININIPVVIGGPFASAFPNLLMKSGMVNACCTGDGAKVAKELTDCLANNRSLRHIPNINFIDDGEIISNPRNQRDDLGEHNKIFYEDFLDLESYVNKFNLYLTRDYDSSIRRAVPILSALGCSYKCAFCENALLGHNHISLSAPDIVEQIIYYNKKNNIDAFSFFDEDFFIDKPRLFNLLEILGKKNLKIKWGTQCRANYFNENYINDKLLKELEKSGCVRLAIGVESGSPKMLKKIKKEITPEQVIRAARYAKDSSIYFSYSFIINLPDETREDFRMTFNLINRLLSIKKNSFVSAIHHYIAYPGTPLSIEAEKRRGYKIEDEFSFEQFRDLSLQEYNSLINPQKKDMYRKCIMYCYQNAGIPFQFKLNIKSVYIDIFKVIAIIRKRLNFYHLPFEIYLIDGLKSIVNKFRRQNSLSYYEC